jgi:xanthine dehydrogenase accessory factor
VSATETIGTIGGGQLEHECTRIAVDMLGANELPSLRRFPLGASMGQCCGGVVEILFEPLDIQLPVWLADLRALHGQRVPAALVTGIDAQGGKFVVTADKVFGPGVDPLPDTIVQLAQNVAAGRKTAERLNDYFVEPVVGSDFNIAVFGAGHVGSAMCATLSRLDCNIRWIDSRRNIFRQPPRNVRAVETDAPPLEVAALPAGSYFLVMTHSHALDLEICERILRRNDAAYCGLIGSLSKRRRFEKRLRQQGIGDAMLGTLVCPIGVAGISGKKPAEIAFATVAELLQVRERLRHAAQATLTDPLPENVRPLRPR